jgi:chemotaxis protein CheZ
MRRSGGFCVQHKQFRIEKMLGIRGGPAHAPEADPVAEFRRNLGTLVSDDEGRPLTRAAAELGAAVESMERAAQTLLAAAESIDDGVRGIAETDPTGHGAGIALDIQHRLSQIYEACNFQDLAGQRIGKVIALLVQFEEQLADVVADGGHAASGTVKQRDGGLINGPRLDGAAGHVDQRDVDLLFD